jgi:hypothetical protein
MPDFVIDGTTLAGPKVAWDGASDDVAAPDMWCRHTDYNELRDAANSLRSYVRPGGVGFTPGSYPLATLTVGASGNITAIAAGSGLTDGDKGDVVVSSGGTVFTIDSHVVTPAKMSQVAANSFLGNNTGSPADMVAMTQAQARTALGLATVATTGSGADLAANSVANTKLAQMATNTIKSNLTGGTADPADNTVAAVATAIAAQLLAGPGHFGDGMDGSASFTGGAVTGWTLAGSTYSTTRPDWFYTSVTINGGITLCMETGGEGTGGGASGRFFANQGITVPSGTATIKINGATPTTAGLQATAMVTGHTGAVAGQGAGGIQNAGQNANNISGGVWFNRYRGGVGGFGGASATNVGSNTAATHGTILADSNGSFNTWAEASLGRANLGNPGAMCGGAGGGSGGGTTGIAKGGGGGNGGGVLIVGIRTKLGAGTLALEAKGGNGQGGESAVGSNAGGGSGGGGGAIEFGCGTSSIPSGVTFSVAGGAGGAPQGTGTAGGAGGTGSKSEYYLGMS